ncbi:MULTISPECIES: hypothetical protein [Cellulophaga]|uniref:hypothetical protein n=1 Tax=Cellulophaga TaxID=104264 RepID=UPI0005A0E992|nr:MULTISPECIES: hypothetical protein [Cellulophaga]
MSKGDKDKLMDMFSDVGIKNPHFHHIVREMAPSTWAPKFRKYILDSQDIIKKAGVDLNTDIRNFTRAANGDGAHTKKAAKYVYDQLSNSKDVVKTMGELAEKMNKGIFF